MLEIFENIRAHFKFKNDKRIHICILYTGKTCATQPRDNLDLSEKLKEKSGGMKTPQFICERGKSLTISHHIAAYKVAYTYTHSNKYVHSRAFYTRSEI